MIFWLQPLTAQKIKYAENKKYLLDNENSIKSYFDAVIEKDGEVVITNTSKFWHCFK